MLLTFAWHVFHPSIFNPFLFHFKHVSEYTHLYKYIHVYTRMRAKSLQSCLTLCNFMVCSPPGSSVHGDSLGKNTGVGCHSLFQGICPAQGSKLYLLCLLHRQAGSLLLVPLRKPLSVYIYIYMCVCVCVYIYICIHIYVVCTYK